jgi:hypothetical protein
MGKHVNKPPRQPDDGKVGYRKPPREHRFPKGKSGNPKGRPPGSRGIKTDLKAVISTVRTVERNGKQITGTTQYLTLEALGLRGSLGDLKAALPLIQLIIEVFGLEDRDVDANRLSPSDQALLERLLSRHLEDDQAEPKAKSRRRSRGSRKSNEDRGNTPSVDQS